MAPCVDARPSAPPWLLATPALADVAGVASVKAIKERDIGMIVLDPLVETHVGLDENSNTDMKDLIVHLRSLARGKAIPILAVHHSRKGATAGDQDGARGGSAMVNACRVVMTVERMSEKEHDDIIKPPRDKEAYVRIVGSKTNYSGRIGDRWMEFDIVDLDCGDEAPALRRKTFGSLGDGFDPTTWEHRDALLKLVRDGRPNGGGGWSTGKRGPKETRLDVAVCDLGLDKGEAGKVIEAFEAAGSIERRKVNDSNRHLKEVWALAQEGAGEPDPEIPF